MRFFLSAFVLIVLISCDSGNQPVRSDWSEEEIELKRDKVKEVMAIHDEAMPWMEETHSLRKKLEVLLKDSISDSLNMVYQNAIQELDQADEVMMVWMRSYKEPNDTGKLDLVLTYLEEEKIKVSEVRAKMAEAIRTSKELL